MATVKEILISRVPFATSYSDEQLEVFIRSAFVNCEPCFGIRWDILDGINVEVWSRIAIEDNYNPIQIQLVSVMAAIALISAKSLADTNNSQSSNASSRFVSEVKAGTTDTKFEQISKDNSPMTLDVDKLISILKSEATSLSLMMGCHINGNMVSVMFSENIISSPIYIHKDLC